MVTNLFQKQLKKEHLLLYQINRCKNCNKKLINVKNSLDFMTKASSSIRNIYRGQIIGITGSCGKTSLKELLAKCLNKVGKELFPKIIIIISMAFH